MAVVIAGSFDMQATGQFYFWISLLIFGTFILDATFTLLRRIFSGEKFWQAHRGHFYQRLALRLGAKYAFLIYITWMLINTIVAWYLIAKIR